MILFYMRSKILNWSIPLLIPLLTTDKINAIPESNLKKENKIETSLTNQRPPYTLGPGDRLKVRVLNFDQFDSDISVLPDGTINLPRIPMLTVRGLTFSETRKLIQNSYEKILIRPVIYIDLINPRPIRIAINGEVHRPGIYTLGIQTETQPSKEIGKNTSVTSGWPTVADAIQKAGGVTTSANLRNIKLISYSKNKISSKQIINYWEVLNQSSELNNPYIFDGDTIRINKVDSLNDKELRTIGKSNLSPIDIKITVIGAVNKPGIQKVRTNAPLNEAIIAAGGLMDTANKKNIKHIRLKSDGSISTKKFIYNPIKGINTKIAPVLQNKDVIIVDSNTLSKFTTTMKSLTSPAEPIIRGATLYKIFN